MFRSGDSFSRGRRAIAFRRRWALRSKVPAKELPDSPGMAALTDAREDLYIELGKCFTLSDQDERKECEKGCLGGF